MIEPGTVIDDRYLVERTLASGGMGTVLVVRHQTLDSLHALKILHVPGREVRERLITEGKVQARLKHPNVAAVTDTLMVDGAPGIVMEFVSGGSLDELLGERTLTLDEIESLFLGILAGVSHAHDQGLVHRDLKPANVLIERLGADGLLPKVTDFGIVKVLEDARPVTGAPRTRTGIGMGTPQYMAPEQADGASQVGPEADVFSLGCMLYEMVLGQRPFESPSVLGILASAADGLYDDPEDARPDLPARFVSAIRGALVPERELRIQTCAELAAVLTEGRVTSLTSLSRAPEREPTPPPARVYPRGQGKVDNHRRRRRRSGPSNAEDSQTWTGDLDGGSGVTTPPPQSQSEPDPEPSRRGGWVAGVVAAGVVVVLGVVGIGALGAGLLGVAWLRLPSATPVVVAPPPGPSPPVVTTAVDTDANVDTDVHLDLPDPPPNQDPPTPVVDTPVVTPTTPPSTTPVTTDPKPPVSNDPRPPQTVVASAPPREPPPSSSPWTLTVTSRRTAPEVRAMLPYRSRRGHLLLVEVTLVNGTGKSADLLAPWTLQAQGQTWLPEAACDVALRKGLSGSVEAREGQSVSGTVCFDVPESVTGGTLSLVPRVGGTAAARARL